MPDGRPAKQAVNRHAHPAQADQRRLVNAGPVQPQFEGHGRTRRRIRLHVADVVHIENAHREKAHGRCRQQQFPVQAEPPGANEIGTQHGHQAEEQEHIDVSLGTIAIRVMAQGIFHGGRYGTGAKHQDQDGREVAERAKGPPGHGRSEHDAKPDEKADEQLHFRDGHLPAVEAVLRAFPLRGVCTLKHVSEFVGKVGKNL